MKPLVAFAALCLVTVSLAAPPAGIAWRQTLGEDFTGATLDTTRWHPHDHFCGTRNNELQAYVPENVFIDSGMCRLRAEVRTVNYSYCGQPGNVKNYTSGVIISADKFDQQYGYFEARCRSPKGKGFWPAFWMLPYDKWPPEIDILEILGHEPDRVYLTNHWSDAAGQHRSSGTSYKGPDFSAGMHEFAVAWNPSEIVWYVDGVQRHRSTGGIPHEPFYILANLAVGGDWPGAPDTSAHFPASYDLDWIRVWQYPDSVLARFNHPPVCTLTSPRIGAIFNAPASITVTAAASDDHRVTRVAFVMGSDTIGSATVAPWSIDLDDVAAGAYVLRAVAFDDSGMSAVSPAVSVRVLDSTGNLIVNGEFNDSTRNWSPGYFSGGAGSIAVVTDAGMSGTSALRFSVTNGGTADWHAMVSQNIPVMQGDTLQVYFLAKAESNRTMRVLIQQVGDPYREYWSQNVNLTTTSQEFGPLTWVVNVSDPTVGFRFLVGGSTADVWLDNVRVIRKPAASTTGPVPAPVVRAVNAVRRVQAFDLLGRHTVIGGTNSAGIVVLRESGVGQQLGVRRLAGWRALAAESLSH